MYADKREIVLQLHEHRVNLFDCGFLSILTNLQSTKPYKYICFRRLTNNEIIPRKCMLWSYTWLVLSNFEPTVTKTVTVTCFQMIQINVCSIFVSNSYNPEECDKKSNIQICCFHSNKLGALIAFYFIAVSRLNLSQFSTKRRILCITKSYTKIALNVFLFSFEWIFI